MRTSDKDKIKKYVANPTFVRCEIFNEDLVGVQNHRTKVLLYKPIDVGMSVLDLSKHLMFDFYCNHLKKEYGDKIRLLYTDTESLVIHVSTDDLYEDMKGDIDCMIQVTFTKIIRYTLLAIRRSLASLRMN